MAKRFTDSGKWSKPFIRALKAPYKLLWLYILDECDHAGIWQVDFTVAQIKIGERISADMARESFAGKIVIFDGGEKWFLPDFIEFQYGTLKEENRAHNSVIQLLKKYQLIDDAYKPLTSPLQGAMDMDKDMDMVKDKDKDKRGEKKNSAIVLPFDSELFKSGWQKWKDYKLAEHKKKYKSAETELAALKSLFEMSGGSDVVAMKIIDQSISNQWQGLFPIKDGAAKIEKAIEQKNINSNDKYEKFKTI